MMMEGLSGIYNGWTILLLAVALFFFIGRSFAAKSAERRDSVENLQRMLNTQLIEQTQRLVETVVRAREESKDAIGQGFGDTRKNLAESLARDRKEITISLDKAQEILTDRLEKLIKETTEIKATSGRMLEIGADIRNLSQILEGPKGRGGFGEFQLEQILSQAIPRDKFLLQYKVGDGIVDAAVQLKDRILCIDSKFPYANLQRYYEMKEPSPEKEKILKLFYSDVKNRAKEINRKYIVPAITLDFAIMFIPAESVFLEIVSNTELHSDLMDMRVVPASPNFLYVYFQALAIGFRGMAVEEQAKEIIGALSELKMGFDKFQGSFKTLGGHLLNAANQYEESKKQATRIVQTLDNLRLGQTGLNPPPPDNQAGEAV